MAWAGAGVNSSQQAIELPLLPSGPRKPLPSPLEACHWKVCIMQRARKCSCRSEAAEAAPSPPAAPSGALVHTLTGLPHQLQLSPVVPIWLAPLALKQPGSGSGANNTAAALGDGSSAAVYSAPLSPPERTSGGRIGGGRGNASSIPSLTTAALVRRSSHPPKLRLPAAAPHREVLVPAGAGCQLLVRSSSTTNRTPLHGSHPSLLLLIAGGDFTLGSAAPAADQGCISASVTAPAVRFPACLPMPRPRFCVGEMPSALFRRRLSAPGEVYYTQATAGQARQARAGQGGEALPSSKQSAAPPRLPALAPADHQRRSPSKVKQQAASVASWETSLLPPPMTVLPLLRLRRVSVAECGGCVNPLSLPGGGIGRPPFPRLRRASWGGSGLS